MKTVFRLRNIHDFLLERGYPEWNYEVYDKKTGEKRKATIEDFDYSGRYSTTDLAFTDKHGNDCNLEVHISDFQFFTYRDESNVMGSGSTTYVDKDFSSFWIDFMLRTYKKDYAKRLLNYSSKNQTRINDEISKKIEMYQKKLEEEYHCESEHYFDLSGKAMNYLTDSDIVDIIETI